MAQKNCQDQGLFSLKGIYKSVSCNVHKGMMVGQPNCAGDVEETRRRFIMSKSGGKLEGHQADASQNFLIEGHHRHSINGAMFEKQLETQVVSGGK